MSRNWTPQQKNAIEGEGGTLLVSAAAGSGKTAVLVERVISRLVDRENPTGADEILVATFTNSAAGEMKERISARLMELLEQSPGDSHLLRQKMLLDTAAIGTVHGFCLQLIRENPGQLSISPDFRIGDEKELELLREDVARELLEERYRQGETDFFHMVELFSQGRDDSKVFSTLFHLYDFIRSRPYYYRWLDSKLALYHPCGSLEETPWGRVVLDYARETVSYCLFMLRKAEEALGEDGLLEEKYGEHFRGLLAAVEELAAKVKDASWDELRQAAAKVDFGRLPSVRGMSDHPGKVLICGYRSQVKEILEELSQKQLCCTEEEFFQDIQALVPIVGELFSLVKDFDRAYSRVKEERRLLDFSDIEQFAIALLTEPEEDKGWRKSELAQALSERYRYILVDEYQDTNEAQDMIFSALSNGKNLFMVGDVKQSIYRFRQAMPEIFLDKKETFSPYNSQDYPAKIILGNNFRSRQEVTDIVNMLFHQLMSPEVGELLYNEEEALIPSAVYPPREGAVELHLLTREKENEFSSAEAEARYAARRIKTMLEEGFSVTEGGELRACEPGDFVILLRSMKNKGEIYRRALEEEGIQALSQDGGGFLESREISVLLSLLRTVDNPLLDIPLTAALLSPIFAFTPDDLAELRLVDKKAPLIVNCRVLAERGGEKWKDFLDVLEELRLLSSLYPADQFIRKAIELTGFGTMAAAMENAPVRTANLRLLSQYARTYDQTGYKGLGGFLRFIDRLEEQNRGLDGARVEAQDSGKVRIMSIHASKGLEFPIVFLCDTAKKFNRMDLMGNTFLHPELGFAAMVRDFEARKQHTTVPVEAVKLELERSLLSEELRMLYVAVTRAREQLVITSVQKDLGKKLEAVNCLLSEENRLPPWAVRRCSSYADWILMSCLHHPDFGETARRCGVEPEGLFPTFSRLRVMVAPSPEETGECTENQALLTAQPDWELVKRFGEISRWEYPYLPETQLPSKVSVTELIKGEEGLEYAFAAAPDFAGGQKLSAADRGTALHQYMLFARHEQGCREPAKEVSRLVEEKFLTPMQGASIPLEMLKVFYRSLLFARMQSAQNVQREFRFMSDVTAADLGDRFPQLGEGRITLQGVADLLFEEEGRLVIVDYKTDNVRSPQELTERYQGQLQLYGRLLSRILEKEVGELLLYSFKLGKTIPVPQK